jgi:hypothetical protein
MVFNRVLGFWEFAQNGVPLLLHFKKSQTSAPSESLSHTRDNTLCLVLEGGGGGLGMCTSTALVCRLFSHLQVC